MTIQPISGLKRIRRRMLKGMGYVRGELRGFVALRDEGRWQAGEPDGLMHRANPLRAFFEAHREGRGISKWWHYFEIYDRHFRRFRGRRVNVLEIGVYSGGSLEMWKSYFGAECQIFGVDIEPACRSYEADQVKVFTGDQADRTFWRRFKREIEHVDIVIDDGGHDPQQQIVSLEELLPHLRPGGVYVCEDVLGIPNEFAAYVSSLAQRLNAVQQMEFNPNDDERRSVCKASSLQAVIGSIHLYPYVVVIERSNAPVAEFVASKHGTQWEPFAMGTFRHL